MQYAFIEVIERLDSALSHQVPEQMALGRRYFRILNCFEYARAVVPQGIDLKPQVFGEQLSE